jgi:hypothetical protein
LERIVGWQHPTVFKDRERFRFITQCRICLNNLPKRKLFSFRGTQLLRISFNLLPGFPGMDHVAGELL